MAATTYDVGDVARISATFAQNGTAMDPSSVAITVEQPDGTQATYTYGDDEELVKDSTGNYHVDIPVTAEGQYRYRSVSTGTGASAAEGFFLVRAREVQEVSA